MASRPRPGKCLLRTADERQLYNIGYRPGRESSSKWEVYGVVNDMVNARRISIRRADQILVCAGYAHPGITTMRLRDIRSWPQNRRHR
jgi:hypothetical protein